MGSESWFGLLNSDKLECSGFSQFMCLAGLSRGTHFLRNSMPLLLARVLGGGSQRVNCAVQARPHARKCNLHVQHDVSCSCLKRQRISAFCIFLVNGKHIVIVPADRRNAQARTISTDMLMVSPCVFPFRN